MGDLSKAQEAAVNWNGRGLLLSAAAGSGKTHTLTQRVVELVTNEDEKKRAHVTEILCVTFTKAAAQELRQRIGDKLRECLRKTPDSKLAKELLDLGRAHIDTIHAFCLDVIRPYAWSEFGLPATLSVADDAQTFSLSHAVMRDLLEEKYRKNEPAFMTLADTLSGTRSENGLDELLLEVYKKLDSRGMTPQDLVRIAGEAAGGTDFFSTATGRPLCRWLERFTQQYCEKLNELLPLLRMPDGSTEAVPFAEGLLRFAEGLLAACKKNSFNEARQVFCLYKSPEKNLPKKKVMQTPEGDSFVKLRESMNDAFFRSGKLRQIFMDATPESMREAAGKNLALVETLAAVLQEYEDRFAERKRERGIVDYADMERFAERILCRRDEKGGVVPTDAARNIAKSYRYIFIDEYQDTNRRQDNIFSALAAAGGVRRFMVGDVKQSIYGFRGAEPSIFSGYRDTWDEIDPDVAGRAGEDEDRSLFLSTNYRSDRTVIDFVNTVCNVLFPAGTLEYDEKKDALEMGKNCPEDAVPFPAEVVIFRKKKDDRNGGQADGANEGGADDSGKDESGIGREAKAVAERVEDLLKNGKRTDGSPILPDDIVLLFRSDAGRMEKFAKALKDRRIKAVTLTKEALFDTPEAALILSVLRAADDPARDIDLAAAMKSPLWDFTLDDLVRIRKAYTFGSLWDAVRRAAAPAKQEKQEDKETGETPDAFLTEALRAKCAAFAASLEKMREDARTLRTDELLLRLYDGGHYGNPDVRTVAANADGGAENGEEERRRNEEERLRNLQAVYERARRFEQNPFDGGLYGFLLSVGSEKDGEKTAAAPKGFVRLMTIHQSKGMQFPVVFLVCAGGQQNRQDSNGSFVMTPSAGAAMKLRAGRALVSCETLLTRSVRCCIRQETAEEEMRILYVALTRAEERLIVTGTVQENVPNGDYVPGTKPNDFDLLDASDNSYMKWILTALAGREHDSFAKIMDCGLPGEDEQPADADEPEPPETDEPPETEREPAPASPQEEAFAEEVGRRLAYRYPYGYLKDVPAKLTVSALKPDVLDGEERGAEGAELTRVPSVPRRKAKIVPRFLSERESHDAAFAGTATHVFMQFCDFGKLAEYGVQAELERLLNAGFLTKEMREAIRVDELERFRESAFFRRIRNAKRVWRELRFNASLPAADFTREEEKRKALAEAGTEVIVQGVVDVLFEDADGVYVLGDYKTDRLTKAELADPALAAQTLLARHAAQLRYYRRVCRDMLGSEIGECVLYSLHSGETAELREE